MGRSLAFSTLGCPGATIAEIRALALGSGWTTLELRVSDEEHVRIGLTPAQRAGVRQSFRDAGLRIACLASYVRVGQADSTDQECVDDLLRHLELAADLGAGGIRVFPGAVAASPEADTLMSRRMSAVAQRFADAGVGLLLETHDSHRAGRDVARVLAAVGHPAVGALWDILHTWLAGESAAETGRELGPWLRYVQIKNVAGRTDLAPVGLGAGVIPVADVLAVLDSLGYRGWLSLEWEKRWYPSADPLPMALAEAGAWLRSRDTD